MKKGFTLIELLAVIVILALIALITVPMILKVVKNAKNGALADSAYGLIEAANLYYIQNLESGIENDLIFTPDETNKGMYSGTIKLTYKGELPQTGSEVILKTNGSVAIRLINGIYCALKTTTDSKVNVTTENCSQEIDLEIPSTTPSPSDMIILQNSITSLQSQINSNTQNITNIKTAMNGIKFGTDVNGNYGYYDASNVFHPF
ncbi:MAG: type II secretion system protein [Bacilli bacterium]|nr:type II secretion system protein [Bacilli bacterium]